MPKVLRQKILAELWTRGMFLVGNLLAGVLFLVQASSPSTPADQLTYAWAGLAIVGGAVGLLGLRRDLYRLEKYAFLVLALGFLTQAIGSALIASTSRAGLVYGAVAALCVSLSYRVQEPSRLAYVAAILRELREERESRSR